LVVAAALRVPRLRSHRAKRSQSASAAEALLEARRQVAAAAATRASSDQPRRWLLQRVVAADRISMLVLAVRAAAQQELLVRA